MVYAMRDGSQEVLKLTIVRTDAEADDDILSAWPSYAKVDDAKSRSGPLGSAAASLARRLQRVRGEAPPSKPGAVTPLRTSPREESGDEPQPPPPEDQDAVRRAVLFDDARRDLPEDWEPVWSRSQNKYYYYSSSTQKCTWKKPPPALHQEQGAGSVVGRWTYPEGTYEVLKEQGELRYRESSLGVCGVLEERNGWLQVELMRCPGGAVAGPSTQFEHIGSLRLVRRDEGEPRVVSNFKGIGVDWEPAVVGLRAGDEDIYVPPRPGAGYEEMSPAPSWVQSGLNTPLDRRQAMKLAVAGAGAAAVVPAAAAALERLQRASSSDLAGPPAPEDQQAVKRAVLLEEASTELPEEWQPMFSRTQGKYYFMNSRTHATVWKKPPPDPNQVEGSGSVLGRWTYAEGTYVVTKEEGELRYREPAFGVFGVFEERDGWLQADLMRFCPAPRNPAGGITGTGRYEYIGTLRLVRRDEGEPRVVSNFKRSGQDWEASVIAVRGGDEEANIVGTWSYPNGSYTVRRKDNFLLYEEAQYGVFGLLQEVPGGWWQAELHTNRGRNDEHEEGLGFIRLKRKGADLISQFRTMEANDWEKKETLAKRVKDAAICGTWQYPEGSYVVSQRGGLSVYEEPSCGISGVLTEGSSGWYEGVLKVKLTGEKAKADPRGERSIGKIRLQRRGAVMVSRFQNISSQEWERDITATLATEKCKV